MAWVIALIIGVIVGALLTYVCLRERMAVELHRWKAEFEERIRRDVLERSRAVLKGRIGEQLTPLLPMFKHEPADARFIGSPVDYVIFDGHSEGEPRRVIFVDVKTGKSAALSPIQRKLKQVIERKRVQWETIHIGALDGES